MVWPPLDKGDRCFMGIMTYVRLYNSKCTLDTALMRGKNEVRDVKMRR